MQKFLNDNGATKLAPFFVNRQYVPDTTIYVPSDQAFDSLLEDTQYHGDMSIFEPIFQNHIFVNSNKSLSGKTLTELNGFNSFTKLQIRAKGKISVMYKRNSLVFYVIVIDTVLMTKEQYQYLKAFGDVDVFYRNVKFAGSESEMVVYILGAGRVGLLLAIKLIQKYQQRIKIIMFEKQAEYTRERVLFLNANTINEILPKELLTKDSLERYGCILKSSPNQDTATCDISDSLEDVENFAISTRVLEADLKAILELPGYEEQVTFIINPDTDKNFIESIVKSYTPHVFVATDDGALSYNLFNWNEPYLTPISKIQFDDQDHNVTNREANREETYEVVVEFKPEVEDTKTINTVSSSKLLETQNRYRIFRQQFKNYVIPNTVTVKSVPSYKPLSYYIAIQVNRTERDRIVKELNGEFVKNYILKSNSNKNSIKYIDRLLLDAANIYKFKFENGKQFESIAIFPLKVEVLKSEDYSRVVHETEIIKFNSRIKKFWYAFIGDAILNMNLFSETEANTGFAMIEYILESLDNIFSTTTRHNNHQLPPPELEYDPRFYRSHEQNIKPTIKVTNTKALAKVIIDDFSTNFAESDLSELVEIYRRGLDEKLITSPEQESEPGLLSILNSDVMDSYLDWKKLLEKCHSDPVTFNNFKQQEIDNKTYIENIDLEEDSTSKVLTKADDRICMLTSL